MKAKAASLKRPVKWTNCSQTRSGRRERDHTNYRCQKEGRHCGAHRPEKDDEGIL